MHAETQQGAHDLSGESDPRWVGQLLPAGPMRIEVRLAGSGLTAIPRTDLRAGVVGVAGSRWWAVVLRRHARKPLPQNGLHLSRKRWQPSWHHAPHRLRSRPRGLHGRRGTGHARRCRLPVGPFLRHRPRPADRRRRAQCDGIADRRAVRPLCVPRARVHHGATRRVFVATRPPPQGRSSPRRARRNGPRSTPRLRSSSPAGACESVSGSRPTGRRPGQHAHRRGSSSTRSSRPSAAPPARRAHPHRLAAPPSSPRRRPRDGDRSTVAPTTRPSESTSRR